MKYRPTILNVVSAITILYFGIGAIIEETKYDAEGWGYLLIIIFVIPGIIGLVIDRILQQYIKNYWIINGAELIVIVVFIIIMSQRVY